MNTNELENKAQANEQNEDQSTDQSAILSAIESQSQLVDLEAQDDVKGGQTREHILLARQVGLP